MAKKTPPAAPIPPAGPITINLDHIDRAAVTEAAAALLNRMEEYQRLALVLGYDRRSSSRVGSAYMQVAVAVIELEQRLTQVGLGPQNGPPRATIGGARSGLAVGDLNTWMLRQHDDEANWGQGMDGRWLGEDYNAGMLPDAEPWITRLRFFVAELTGGRPADPPSAAPTTIWHHGGKSYSTDGITPILVPPEQHNALFAFLDGDEALATKDLADKGICNVTVTMNKLMAKFGKGAFRSPGGHKGDGYYIRVRTLEKSTPTD